MEDLRLKLVGDKVIVERDEGTHCCGENRYEWVKISSIDKNVFAKNVLDLLEMKIKTVSL